MNPKGEKRWISNDEGQHATRKSLRPSPRRKEIEEDWARVLAAKAPDSVSTTHVKAVPTTHVKAETDQNDRSTSVESAAGTAVSKTDISSAGKRSHVSSPGKKRPYRRTKRPKNYNDKSTVTTTTRAAETPINVYDAVLGESEDLLKAAAEAQALGRLKMASNFLFLLHSRLIGLGKKFERAKRMQGESERETSHFTGAGGKGENLKPTRLDLGPPLDGDPNGSPQTVETEDDKKTKAIPKQTEEEKTSKKDETDEKKGSPHTPVPSSNSISEAALNQLSNYLPPNIELDVAMMEHLARAAVELQLKRAGRKSTEDGLLNSPAINTEQVLHYNKDAYPSPPKKSAPTKASVAWTEVEQAKFRAAVQKVGTDEPAKIAKMMGTRNEAQVRAYLRNLSEIEKGTAAMEKEMLEDTPRKRGGRGRKPPTTAMNTVPNANLDAKSMLQNLRKNE